MNRIRVIPVLLHAGGGLIKPRAFRGDDYVGDPINVLRIFNDKEVDEVFVIDVAARSPDFAAIETWASECFMPFGYGGAIRTFEDAQRVFGAGVEKVCLQSSAIEPPHRLVTEIARAYGSQAVVVAIDARKRLFGGYRAMTHRGRRSTGRSPLALAQSLESAGAGEILLTRVEREGTGRGYDLELTAAVARGVTIPVIAHGGAARVEDFRAAVDAGASAAAAGTMFVFQGKHRAVLVQFPDPAELRAKLANPSRGNAHRVDSERP